MHWIPLYAWIAAVVVAIVVLGFCAYELMWKTKRLRGDLERLQTLTAELDTVQHTLAAAQQRMAAVRPPGSALTR
ncbi:hypothetical protein [uncultured Jatrophihabitans sp.]|uniref:hypothetical protein n=1 Tax=uncultured Jatrophihabitans sp. TaxID=1610747 RepID=UPI0035C94CF8